MGIGHLGLAFASKRFAPRASLGLLLLAGIFLDVVWSVSIAVGLEHARIVPGITAANPLEFTDYPISHSLVAAIAWSALFAGVYLYVTKDRRAALLCALGVGTHWLLDVASHRPDVPVLPRGPYWGFGLWHSVSATLLIEAAIMILGVLIYARSTYSRDGIGSIGLWVAVGFLLLVHLGACLGPPPPSMAAVVLGNALLALPLIAAAIADHHRRPRHQESGSRPRR